MRKKERERGRERKREGKRDRERTTERNFPDNVIGELHLFRDAFNEWISRVRTERKK